MNLNADVLNALREGKSLCPYCLGRKYIVGSYLTDFGPLERRKTKTPCRYCLGSDGRPTGLDATKG